MEVTKVYRAISFRQEEFLAPWIDMCASKRAAAKNDFEKDLYKLMANAVLGKTMQNVRIVTTDDDAKKLAAKHNLRLLIRWVKTPR